MVLACAGRDTGRRGVISIDIERLPCVDYLLNVNGFTTDDITLVDIDAAIVAKNWPAFRQNQDISFLFIDADHSETGVRSDYRMYSPLVRKGGMIAFHDIAITRPEYGVRKLWSELKTRHPTRECLGKPLAYGLGLLYV